MTPRELPDPVARRFEAIVVVGESAATSTAMGGRLVELAQAGMDIAVMAALPLRDWADRLAGQDGGGVVLLAGSRGTELALADGSGVHLLGSPVIARDGAPLEQAGRLVIERLAEVGISAAWAGSDPPATAAIDLQLGGPSGAAPITMDEFLLDHGLLGPDACTELAAAAARQAGIEDPRVSLSGGRLTIATADERDATRWAIDQLWRRGVPPTSVLIVDDGVEPLRCARLLVPASERATIACAEADAGAVPPSVVVLAAGPKAVQAVIEDQLVRRRRHELPATRPETGWELTVEGFDPDREHVHASLLALADGRIGTSSPPVPTHPDRGPSVLAAGVYDEEGPATHLLTAPDPFGLPCQLVPDQSLRRTLDLRCGVLTEESSSEAGPVMSTRFLSLARPGTVVMRATFPAGAAGAADPLLPPRDDRPLDAGVADGASWMRVAGSAGGVAAAAADEAWPDARGLDRVAVYDTDPDRLPDPAAALDRLRESARCGFDRLLVEHRRSWASRWEDADIVIEGDDELQAATRFNLFHLMASVPDAGEAAVGARGLSGTGYRGHVFWDADTFVLPFLAATHPASARAMLEYRIRRLPVAMADASVAGRRGARFPWESAGSGHDVTPTSARDRSGKTIPIRTGQFEEHIVTEVAWAACCYADWTGDEAFEAGPGLRLLAETARYWASRIRSEPDGTAHIYGVIGPDEYHEVVDDNAFTNVMARWNLRRAADAVERVGGAARSDTAEEVARWRQLADALIDGYDPDTEVYEQFAGFGRLEPLIIEEVAPRRPIAADLLLGADRVRRAQVLKQADVLMLHHLVPDEVAPGSLEPNLRFYEPRTAHGSSLSPGIHAALFARARDFGHALEALRIASRIDLDDLTGSTAGGLHLATMGGVWQALAFGFGGLRPAAGRLRIDPCLPPDWAALELRVRFRGSRVRVRKERALLSIWADPAAPVVVGSLPFTADPAGSQFRRRGTTWEPTS